MITNSEEPDGVTPCPEYTLGDLLDHVGGLMLAFTAAATKTPGGIGSQGPSGDAARLGDDWRTRIPRDLAALAQAWRDPAAWDGTTRAGGLELPREVAGLVVLDELGPVVEVPDDAPLLDRVIGLSGRVPAWSPY